MLQARWESAYLIPQEMIGMPLDENSLSSIPIEEFLAGCAATGLLSADTETNGEDIRDGRGYCQGISSAFRYAPGIIAATYLPIRHSRGFNYTLGLREAINTVFRVRAELSLPIVGHNWGKFDRESLRTAGINPEAPYYDTMLMGHLLDENAFNNNLDTVAKKYLGKEIGKQENETFKKVKAAMGWGGIPSDIMYDYAVTDAGLPLLIWEAMQPAWKAEKLEDYWRNHKVKSVSAFQNMERRGVAIDVPMCEREIDTGEQEMLDIAYHLGGKPSGNYLKWLLLDKLELPVVKKTDKGNPSFDKEAMALYEEILENRNDVTAQLILAHRGWEKTVSSNYRAYIELRSPDGRLRPNYKLHGTRTGRVSCAQPNLQQIPKESAKPWNGKTKKAFIGRPGYTLIGLDYSQLEFRIGAAYAGEEKLKTIFNDETRDIFSEMAEEMSMLRQDIKIQVYTMSYGGGVRRISHVFGISETEARTRIDNYYATYPGFRSVTILATRTCKSTGKDKLWSGRDRHFMFPQSQGYKAFNSACQGGAADIVENRMHAVEELGMPEDECRMLLQVHDELIFEIRTDLLDTYVPMLKAVMEDVPGREFWGDLKFKVDSKAIS